MESRRFRLKTLWQVQYTSIRTVFDAPKAPLFDPTTGAPLVDASGNPISYAGIGSKWFISPGIRLGDVILQPAATSAGKRTRPAGTLPHHNTVWDADTSANFKYGHLELRVGAKAFHFKTSTKRIFTARALSARHSSAFAGIRSR